MKRILILCIVALSVAFAQRDTTWLDHPIKVNGGGVFYGTVRAARSCAWDIGTNVYKWRKIYAQDGYFDTLSGSVFLGDLIPDTSCTNDLGDSLHKWARIWGQYLKVDTLFIGVVTVGNVLPWQSCTYNFGDSLYKWAQIWTQMIDVGDRGGHNDVRFDTTHSSWKYRDTTRVVVDAESTEFFENYINIYKTLDPLKLSNNAVTCSVTTDNDTFSQPRRAMKVLLVDGGWSGGDNSYAGYFNNSAVGTVRNYGLYGYAQGSGVRDIGIGGIAANGNENVGILGTSIWKHGQISSENLAIYGIAWGLGATQQITSGLFTIDSMYEPTTWMSRYLGDAVLTLAINSDWFYEHARIPLFYQIGLVDTTKLYVMTVNDSDTTANLVIKHNPDDSIRINPYKIAVTNAFDSAEVFPNGFITWSVYNPTILGFPSINGGNPNPMYISRVDTALCMITSEGAQVAAWSHSLGDSTFFFPDTFYSTSEFRDVINPMSATYFNGVIRSTNVLLKTIDTTFFDCTPGHYLSFNSDIRVDSVRFYVMVAKKDSLNYYMVRDNNNSGFVTVFADTHDVGGDSAQHIVTLTGTPYGLRSEHFPLSLLILTKGSGGSNVSSIEVFYRMYRYISPPAMLDKHGYPVALLGGSVGVIVGRKPE